MRNRITLICIMSLSVCFADVTASNPSPVVQSCTNAASTKKTIPLDSFMGYTLGKKYTFEGFEKTTVAEDKEHHYHKNLSPNETLSIHTTLDGTVIRIGHSVLFSDSDAAENLVAVQQLVASMESDHGIKFKQSGESDSLQWSCGDGRKHVVVSFLRGNFVKITLTSSRRSTYTKCGG